MFQISPLNVFRTPFGRHYVLGAASQLSRCSAHSAPHSSGLRSGYWRLRRVVSFVHSRSPTASSVASLPQKLRASLGCLLRKHQLFTCFTSNCCAIAAVCCANCRCLHGRCRTFARTGARLRGIYSTKKDLINNIKKILVNNSKIRENNRNFRKQRSLKGLNLCFNIMNVKLCLLNQEIWSH